ncbi:hydrolase Nlp/P60 [Eggerthellaceae bacterium zg-1084]|uniref:coiled-coil domain-containing protein n=1 Tax=Berryella wangjianweii TaxID=2734634 RepID=UPI00155356D6|nr:NlpC/P60 family protein [Berryella wangjianweii]NPD31611.1 hydrolase Nlp/P60 [Berryella wangjianweii]
MASRSARAQRTRLPRRIACGSLSIALALSMSAFAVPTQAQAVTAAQKQQEAEAALTQMNAMQQQLDRASADYGEALAQQQNAEEQRDDASARIDALEGEIDEVQGRLASRARSMYRGGPTSFLDLLLGSATFAELTENWGLIARVNDSDAALVERSRALRDEAREQRDRFDEQAKLAAEKADEAKRIADEAAGTVEQMRSTYESLSAEARQLVDAEREAQRQAAQQAAQAYEAAAPQRAQQQSAPEVSAPSAGNGGSSSAGSNGGGASAPSYVPSTGNAILDRAYSQLGKPYGWGATGMAAFDCSGFVGYALTGSPTRIGTTYTYLSWPRVSNPQPGDVCTNAEHCGIYIGGGQMIHAATDGVGVIVGPVQPGMVYVRR